MNTQIAAQLKSLPDLEPPADGWQRLERRVRLGRLRRRGRYALAASVVLACIGVLATGAWRTEQAIPVESESSSVRPLIVSAPAGLAESEPTDPALLALQARSRNMERYLQARSRSARVTSADTAGVIAELEDRIAAVDYQLTRSAYETAEPASSQAVYRKIPAEEPQLWRQRVEYMDQLMRAHYVDGDVTGF